MKKILPPFILISAFLISCAGSDEKKSGTDSMADTTTKPVVHVPKLDSVPLKTADCIFHCERSKTVKEVEKDVRVMGSIMHMKLDNASFTAETDIAVHSGNWYTIDGKMRNATLVLDMSSVEAMKVGDDKKLEMGNPDYLETKKYPYAYLNLDSLSWSTDSLGNNSGFIIVSRLQLKDKDESIELRNIKMENMDAATGIPEKLSFDFTINGIEWGLNAKDAKVTKDQLKFHVVMKR